MRDNVRAHAERTVTLYPQDVGMTALEWPANSQPMSVVIDTVQVRFQENIFQKWRFHRYKKLNHSCFLRLPACREYHCSSSSTINIHMYHYMSQPQRSTELWIRSVINFWEVTNIFVANYHSTKQLILPLQMQSWSKLVLYYLINKSCVNSS